MLKLTDNLADALSDALGFGVIWFDDAENPELTSLRTHCSNLEDKIDNQHTQFTPADLMTMRKAIDVFIYNCDEVTDDHSTVQTLLGSLPPSGAVTINYI